MVRYFTAPVSEDEAGPGDDVHWQQGPNRVVPQPVAAGGSGASTTVAVTDAVVKVYSSVSAELSCVHQWLTPCLAAAAVVVYPHAQFSWEWKGAGVAVPVFSLRSKR